MNDLYLARTGNRGLVEASRTTLGIERKVISGLDLTVKTVLKKNTLNTFPIILLQF